MKKEIKKGNQKENDKITAAIKKLFPTHDRHILMVFKDTKNGSEAAFSANCGMKDMINAHKAIEEQIFSNGGGMHMVMQSLDGLLESMAISHNLPTSVKKGVVEKKGGKKK